MKCTNCGTEIESENDAVYSSGGLNEENADRLADGETLSFDEAFDFEEGPYCSLDCSVSK